MSSSNNHGFNTVYNSQLPKRERRNWYRRIAIAACCVILALIATLLIALAIGHAVTSATPGQGGPGEDTPPVTNGAVEYENATFDADDTKAGALILVDADHAYTAPSSSSHLGYISNAFSSTGAYVSGLSSHMDKTAAAALADMLTAQNTANGSPLMVRYAYMSKDDANFPSGTTTTDELCTGLVVDLRLYNKDDGNADLSTNATVQTWFTENAHKYGFIPAPQGSTTYYRYVGVAHATYMYQNNLTLADYLDDLTDHGFKNQLEVTGADGNRYKIYYAAVSEATEVSVPTNYECTISGTNMDGIVVTVNLSAPIAAPVDTTAASLN